ncbi:Ubiquitin-conjugating enzyme E2 J1 [Lasiodiplodia theobromae]|uniref:Ubiquitin-conjugating enzyme E2 J1 n=1 Tax=Lasiodiplodia theobromae TaxID=45133 RepID=A0A5N5CTK2_9PEZI|nr:Ubiquitin-conjugating enzyme E2 J1 [Lasiodiplodia theobromae]
MTTRGQFNTKNPTIKRILKEAAELASHASADYHAEPLEDNLFEWHFTLRGPPAPSPYAGGLYHGRIILPAQYPLRPPSFRFVTPTGRFEVNREICLSISGHHEETWQPAWGIRTALVAIRSFMDTDAKGQVGGIDSTEVARRKMAAESGAFRCAACGGRSNAEIMREREELAREAEGEGKQEEEAVPEELRLAYREDLAKEDGEGEKAQASSSGAAAAAAEKTADGDAPTSSAATPPRTEPATDASPTQSPTTTTTTAAAAPAPPRAAAPGAPAVPAPTRTVPAAAAPALRQQQRPLDDGVPAWIDKAIYGVLGALAFMILRKFF